MPKLVYFDFQGRGQPIRYLLASKGVEFEDIRLTVEEWFVDKAAGTYGMGNMLPLLVEDDGSIKTQRAAILAYLAHKHGVLPTTD